jgi:iron only hydrogenase large subunit-like protein
MQPITTITEKCRKCYSCVRSCPVKAIKVEKDYSEIISERCIGCGNCFNACPQNAKVIMNQIAQTEEVLAGNKKVIAVLGASFPAHFNYIKPEQLVTGLKKLGFSEVHEEGIGAEIIGDAYSKALTVSEKTLISSHCPAIVDLIEQHYPELVGNLMPIVSPKIAVGN